MVIILLIFIMKRALQQVKQGEGGSISRLGSAQRDQVLAHGGVAPKGVDAGLGTGQLLPWLYLCTRNHCTIVISFQFFAP